MLAIWTLVPLPFLNPVYTSGSSWFTQCWSLAWRILSITLLAYEINTTVQYLEHSLALPYFGIGMKIDLFQSCGHCWAFQICWHIECGTLTAPSFRISNNSAGISSPPLGFPHSSAGKESACNAGDPGLISGSGRSSGEGNGNPLQYCCLEHPMDWSGSSPWGHKESDTT